MPLRPHLLLAALLLTAGCVTGDDKGGEPIPVDPDGDLPSVCGDGEVSGSEACDDGNTDDGDYCAADCLNLTGSCGDGTTQSNELCDDGNNDDGDYCAADCLNLTGSCGDGTTQSNELCDDGNTDDGDYCAADCLNLTGSCGDSTTQSNEACDDGTVLGAGYCSADCQTVLGACGDGVVQPNETCDGARLGGRDCTTEGFSLGELTCDPVTCQLDLSACTNCGDDFINRGEVCDGDALDTQTCGTLGDFDYGAVSCQSDCSDFDLSDCCLTLREPLVLRPAIDLIIPVDNSGSMNEEILALQQALNTHLVPALEAFSIDYRVILIARHGDVSSESVCIEAPLSGIPTGGCVPPPAQPVNNPPSFFHYSVEIASHDALCKLFTTFAAPDEFGQPGTGQGWGDWLRADSFKAFLVMTDDGVSCGFTRGGNSFNLSDGNSIANGDAAAAAFDAAWLADHPTEFGTQADRRYVFYSTVGIAPNPIGSGVWLPSDPVSLNECPTAADPGTGYQSLSQLTGGLRFPSCDDAGFPDWFTAVAEDAVARATNCDFDLPSTLGLAGLTLAFTPARGQPAFWDQVDSESACAGVGWYLDDNSAPTSLRLCPASCELVSTTSGTLDAASCP